MSNSAPSAWETPLSSIALDSAQIHIWLFDLNLPDNDVNNLKKHLSGLELQKAEKIKEPNTRKQFITSHGISRKILSKYTNTSAASLLFTIGEHGKPFLDTPNEHIHFNLSHSFEHGVIAITINSDLGIDIENTNRHVDEIKLSARFFTENEARAIKTIDDHKRKLAFFRAWTRKEAILKATGKGISYGLNKFEVGIQSYKATQAIYTSHIPDNNKWILFDLPDIGNYVSALAVENKKWDILCWKWTGDQSDKN